MNHATFFVSPGRCGTQWLCKTLQGAYGDRAQITHEPIKRVYQPKKYLRHPRIEELKEEPVVADHLAFIHETLSRRPYIETGWPSYVALPLLAKEFAGRLRVVHLVRNPVRVALSMTTHGFYRREGVATLAPEDPGVLQVPARDWSRMTQYEKCLFCWTEVNLLALEFHEKYPAVPYHRVRFEDLLSADGSHFEQLVGFMMLPPNPTLVDAASNRVDAHHKKARPVDWRLVFGHPQTVELARRLGYPLDDFSDSALTRRYFKWRRLAKARRSVGFRRIVLG